VDVSVACLGDTVGGGGCGDWVIFLRAKSAMPQMQVQIEEAMNGEMRGERPGSESEVDDDGT